MDTAFENGFALNQGSILKRVDSTPTTDSTNLVSSGGVKTYVDQKDAATNERIDTVNTQLAASFFFKGSSTYVALPVSGNTINDTYYVTDNDKQCWYSWDGTAWVQSSMSQADYAGLIAQLKADMSSEFSTQKTYNVGDFCLYGADGKLYVCKTAITTTGAAWDSTKWDEVAFADAISDLILATDTQPTSTANKIWLDTDEVPDTVEVVTVEDLANIVAPEFATASAYSTGDYVMHNAELYRAKQNSAANDGWVAARWQKITVMGEMTDELTNVKTQLDDETKRTTNNFVSLAQDGSVTELNGENMFSDPTFADGLWGAVNGTLTVQDYGDEISKKCLLVRTDTTRSGYLATILPVSDFVDGKTYRISISLLKDATVFVLAVLQNTNGVIGSTMSWVLSDVSMTNDSHSAQKSTFHYDWTFDASAFGNYEYAQIQFKCTNDTNWFVEPFIGLASGNTDYMATYKLDT